MFSVDNCQNEMNVFVCSSIKILFVFKLNEKLIWSLQLFIGICGQFFVSKSGENMQIRKKGTVSK